MLPSQLAKNFKLSELTRVSDPIPASLESTTLDSVAHLQRVRDVIGVPFAITSFYRIPSHNEAVGGSSTSDHMNAKAFDLKPQGISLYEFYRRWQAAERSGDMPVYDQMIVYPFTTGHVHIGFGSRMRRQTLLRVSEQQYRDTGRQYVSLFSLSQIPKRAAATLGVLALLAVAFLLFLVLR